MYQNRKEAAVHLASFLLDYKNNPKAIVIALPRGGVVIGYEIAKILHLPLDIVVPRKIGAPFNEELAIGSICMDESTFDEELIAAYSISQDYIQKKIKEEKKEAQRRLNLYRASRPPLILTNKIVLLVDDGIATGATMISSLKYIQKQKPEKIVIAVPIAADDTVKKIEALSIKVVCPHILEYMMSISQGYEEFFQVNDETVIQIMEDKTLFQKGV